VTLTSDDLEIESHIVVNVSSTLTNTTLLFGLWLHCVSLWTCGRMYHVCTDIFTGFIRSSLRRWPKYHL